MVLRKVAYLTPLYFDKKSYLGGGERFPLNIARGVVHASEGTCTVELISYGAAPEVRTLAPGITLRVLRDANRHKNPLLVVSWDLSAAIADADLVHVHAVYTRSSEMGILLAKLQRKPLCMTDLGGRCSSLGSDLGSLDLADRIITFSDFGAEQYDTKAPIEVIKGGVDATLFHPPARRPKRDRVLYVGRLLPHKGIDQLIQALPPELPLTVCGQPYHARYYEHLQELARGKQVEFVTDADDATILDLYRRAWVNVLPSVYQDCYGTYYDAPELMGFTLLEAMACGTPAICSRVGAMPEFIREGETGFVFDTPSDLTAQLRLLAGDPALVEQIGRRARQVVLAEFDLKVAGRKVYEVYRALTSRAEEAAA